MSVAQKRHCWLLNIADSHSPDRQCLTAMCNQPKQLLRILHIFVAYLTIGDCKFQIGVALEHVP